MQIEYDNDVWIRYSRCYVVTFYCYWLVLYFMEDRMI